MSREDGFQIADIDVGLFADPKVGALVRRLKDPVKTAAYVALYIALVVSSWKAGKRLTLDDGVPVWWIDPIDDVLANLQAVALLDGDGKVPEHAWHGWFVPAATRREIARQAGRRGGQAKARNDRAASFAIAALRQRHSGVKGNLNPTVPTNGIAREHRARAAYPADDEPSPVPCAACGISVNASDTSTFALDAESHVVHRACLSLAAVKRLGAE